MNRLYYRAGRNSLGYLAEDAAVAVEDPANAARMVSRQAVLNAYYNARQATVDYWSSEADRIYPIYERAANSNEPYQYNYNAPNQYASYEDKIKRAEGAVALTESGAEALTTVWSKADEIVMGFDPVSLMREQYTYDLSGWSQYARIEDTKFNTPVGGVFVTYDIYGKEQSPAVQILKFAEAYYKSLKDAYEKAAQERYVRYVVNTTNFAHGDWGKLNAMPFSEIKSLAEKILKENQTNAEAAAIRYAAEAPAREEAARKAEVERAERQAKIDAANRESDKLQAVIRQLIELGVSNYSLPRTYEAAVALLEQMQSKVPTAKATVAPVAPVAGPVSPTAVAPVVPAKVEAVKTSYTNYTPASAPLPVVASEIYSVARPQEAQDTFISALPRKVQMRDAVADTSKTATIPYIPIAIGGVTLLIMTQIMRPKK